MGVTRAETAEDRKRATWERVAASAQQHAEGEETLEVPAPRVSFYQVGVSGRTLATGLALPRFEPPLVVPKFQTYKLVAQNVETSIDVKQFQALTPSVKFRAFGATPVTIEPAIGAAKIELPPPPLVFVRDGVKVVKAALVDDSQPSGWPGAYYEYVEYFFREALGLGEGSRLTGLYLPTVVIYEGDERFAESLAALAAEVLLTEHGLTGEVVEEVQPNHGVYIARRGDIGTLIGHVAKVVILSRETEKDVKALGRARIIIAKAGDVCKLACLARAACGFCDENNDENHKGLRFLDIRSPDVLTMYRTGEVELYQEAERKVPKTLDRPSVGGEESAYHRFLKLFAAYHLLEVEKVSPDQIYVEGVNYRGESRSCGCGGVPDICVQGRAIDAKACIGQRPDHAVLEAAWKYGANCEVWVVLRPITFMLYASDIAKALRDLKKVGKKVEVRIPAREKDGLRLIKPDEFIKRLRECFKECERGSSLS